MKANIAFQNYVILHISHYVTSFLN